MKKSYFFLMLFIICVIFAGCKIKQQEVSTKKSEVNSKTYPRTGSVIRNSTLMDEIIPPGELPEIIAEGFEWTEGPLWLPDQNILLFSDIPENSIFQWSEESGLKLYLKPSGYTGTTPRGGETGSNGLVLNNKGQLVLCQHGDRRMALMNAPLDKPAPEFITLADNWQGKKFNSPNDAVYNSKGDLFFTDPAYGMEFGFKDPKREMDFTGVYKLSREGVLTLLTDKMTAPNGIDLSPDETRLYVTNSGAGTQAIWMEYRFREDGSLDEGRIFYDASDKGAMGVGGPDGLEVRNDGIIFSSGPGGIWIFTPEGTHLGTVLTGQQTSNCSIDYKGKYLYFTADMYIMRIKLK